MISTLLSLLRLVLWPSMWPILENVPCALENDMHSAVWVWNALFTSTKFNWYDVSFTDAWMEMWRRLEGLEVHFYCDFTISSMCVPWLESCSGLGDFDAISLSFPHPLPSVHKDAHSTMAFSNLKLVLLPQKCVQGCKSWHWMFLAF